MNAAVGGPDGVARCADDPESSVLPATKTSNEEHNIFKRIYISHLSPVQQKPGKGIHELL